MGIATYAPKPAPERAAKWGHFRSVSAPTAGAIPRFYLLDGLRLAAALAVVLYHFSARRSPGWEIPVSRIFPEFSYFSAFGAFGVQLFFIISGFVILLTAWGRTIGDFTASRVGRLFPAYWAGVLLTSFLLLALWPDGWDITPTQALVNLTMMQEGMGVENVDGVYWTLWVELKFYILIGIFMVIGITKVRVVFFCTMWPLAAAVAEETGSAMLAELLMPEYAPFFAGGMLLFLMVREGQSILLWLLLGLNVFMGAHHTAHGEFKQVQKFTYHTYPEYLCWIVVAFLFALVATVVLTRLSQVSWTILTAAGTLTYPLYLIHEHWGWWFISLMSPVLPYRVVLVLAILLCLVMAWLIHRYVEIPFGSRLRWAVKNSLIRLSAPAREEQSRRQPSNADESNQN